MGDTSRDELEVAWQEVRELHKEYLERHDVKLPSRESFKWVWLATLWHHRDRHVHKDEVSRAVRLVFPDAAADQQVRHLKRDGWSIESDGKGGHKSNPYKPSPEYVNELARRKGRIGASSFDELKTVYGSRCATCGAREGHPDPRYGDDLVKLQQGHQDPAKPINNDNVLPQCQFCNRAYKNDFAFDDKGRVRAIASVAPVRRASAAVRKQVKDWLNRRQ